MEQTTNAAASHRISVIGVRRVAHSDWRVDSEIATPIAERTVNLKLPNLWIDGTCVAARGYALANGHDTRRIQDWLGH
jgi:hypothetical protein